MAALFSVSHFVGQPSMPWWIGLPLNFTVFPAGGYWWGRTVWRTMEAKYLAAKAEGGW